MPLRRTINFLFLIFTALITLGTISLAQDSSTGAIRGVIRDPSHAVAAGVTISARNVATNEVRQTVSDSQGNYLLDFLAPGSYQLTADPRGFKLQPLTPTQIEAGQVAVMELNLIFSSADVVTISGETPLVETQASAVSSSIPQQAIEGLPLNGRRFQDLALLTGGVTQDPRSLTSSSNGDLAFGGLRGWHTSFLVDGSDNNNGFFAQARGRYRAPYQFSNEVVQEFTISTNSYGAELAGAGGAVVNVVTKSGSNHLHGSGFYYLRDSAFNARPPLVPFKPADRQQQFGFTLGGPIRKNKAFLFAGFDQHIFHVPQVVEFGNGSAVLTPVPNGITGDYEASDQALVLAAAARLNTQAGEFRSSLLGNAGFARMDVQLTPRHVLNARVSTSRYYGANNVFFDPASPIINSALTSNGEEDVATESANLALTSALAPRVTSHARLQFSRDLQQSTANSAGALQQISGVLQGLGRSSILPRQTNEHRLSLAETLSVAAGHHSWKFGGDVDWVWTRNFFPRLFGGEYFFQTIKVNPFTFVPQVGGLELTPLRAYAHQVPRIYEQYFGSAVSHPDSRQYAAFIQDAIRVTDHLALNLGVRYDLQTFRSDGLVSNPLYPDSGKVPFDTDNMAPRAGFAYSLGNQHPLVIRGGYGIFYTRIPQIYTSAVELQNGINQQHLRLNNTVAADRLIFPQYPNPLVSCPPAATSCAAPANATGKLTSDVSAFAHNFQTPYVQQANASVERELPGDMAIEANYLYVHGSHLIRARDVNLPKPVVLEYPVFDDSGTNFLGTFYSVDSFSTWQFTQTLDCPFPPCINPLTRPEARLAAINVFESEASSVYNGFTFGLRRRMRRGLYFRVGYTLAHAIDDNQDALVAGRPATVQNSFATHGERGNSVTDQRNRFVASWMWEPRPFHREHPALARVFDDWKLAGIVTVGSGRPIDAKVLGDANQDGNSDNDRLPAARRNSFTGPDYATTDLRLSRFFAIGDRWKLELLVESFNLLNRDNQRVDTTAFTDDGFLNSAAQFVELDKKVNNQFFPAHFRSQSSFLHPTSAYAPRQVQVAIKVRF